MNFRLETAFKASSILFFSSAISELPPDRMRANIFEFDPRTGGTLNLLPNCKETRTDVHRARGGHYISPGGRRKGATLVFPIPGGGAGVTDRRGRERFLSPVPPAVLLDLVAEPCETCTSHATNPAVFVPGALAVRPGVPPVFQRSPARDHPRPNGRGSLLFSFLGAVRPGVPASFSASSGRDPSGRGFRRFFSTFVLLSAFSLSSKS